jgi:putative phosphoesterase
LHFVPPDCLLYMVPRRKFAGDRTAGSGAQHPIDSWIDSYSIKNGKPPDLNRIAVLSDIHGNILALEAVVADLKRREVDSVVNLGDHLSGPLWPRETAELLMRQEWIHIVGNMDEALINQDPRLHSLSDAYAFKCLTERSRDWLRSLPMCVELQAGILLFHGTPTSTVEYLLETVERTGSRQASSQEVLQRLGGRRARLMLCGHTHVQRIVGISEECLIVNPGSVGLPAYDDNMPYPHVMESCSPHARYAIVDVAGSKCTVQLLAIPYDWDEAAEQARKQNRPEWGVALETGMMKRN